MNPFNPKFPTTVSHDFAKVPRVQTQRSAFKCPATYKTMFDAGKLIPFSVIEVIPGATIKMDNSMLCRLNTPFRPFIDNLYLDTQYFFVPCRLLWTNWEKFMGAKDNPGDSTTYTVPVVTGPAAGFAVETVYDYMGIPINMTKNVNALPLRAYNLIYKHHYKDQNIINDPVINTDDGPDLDTEYTVRRRGKRHDYFTSCLAAPQQGTAASFAFTGSAPVLGIGKVNQTWDTTDRTLYESDGTTQLYANSQFIAESNNVYHWYVEEGGGARGGSAGYPRIFADLTNVSGLTIAEFRETIQLQALAEIENRGGHRYVEILYNVFNVISPDFRMAIPEYLGGSSTPIYVVPVANTANALSSGDTYFNRPGELAGYAVGFKSRDGFTKSFTEHGYVIGICSVRADLSYSQGLHRMWTRSTKYDFFNPLLQNIGDQAVLRQEIYLADNDSASDSTVFGYQERYAEYMYMPSHITGKLRPAYSSPADYWHLSEEFSSAPTLSQTFIEENPPIDRIVASSSEPDFIMDVHMDVTMVQPMALHSIPGYLGRF